MIDKLAANTAWQRICILIKKKFPHQNSKLMSTENIDQNELHEDFINSDSSIPGTSHLNDDFADDITSETVDDAEIKLQEANDKYLRLAAEFDNFRKRNARERMELIKNAGEDIINSLLDVLDDSDRALAEIAKGGDAASLKTGVELVFGKLRNIMKAKGLTEMESTGHPFDAEEHEAIAEVPAADDRLEGKVIDTVSKGYKLNDKIIRHAKVVVGK